MNLLMHHVFFFYFLYFIRSQVRHNLIDESDMMKNTKLLVIYNIQKLKQ